MEETRKLQTLVTAKFMGIVFLYMFIALFITAGVSALVGYLFTTIWPIDYSDNTYLIYLITLIVSAVLMVGVNIWFSFAGYRTKGGLYIPFAIYSILMGVLVSSFTMFVDFYVLALSFAMTCLAFLIMALIGILSKGNINFLLIVALGTLSGALFIGIMNWVWYLLFPSLFDVAYLIIEFSIFVVVMLITAVDVWRIKQIVLRGEANNNLALYCAFNLYVDFINIFIRILSVVASSKKIK